MVRSEEARVMVTKVATEFVEFSCEPRTIGAGEFVELFARLVERDTGKPIMLKKVTAYFIRPDKTSMKIDQTTITDGSVLYTIKLTDEGEWLIYIHWVGDAEYAGCKEEEISTKVSAGWGCGDEW